FSSALPPPYLRKTRSLEELIPWLYLKGVSTGDFSEALQAHLGPEAPGLSAPTITRLKAVWEAEHQAWARRSLAGRHYVYGRTAARSRNDEGVSGPQAHDGHGVKVDRRQAESGRPDEARSNAGPLVTFASREAPSAVVVRETRP